MKSRVTLVLPLLLIFSLAFVACASPAEPTPQQPAAPAPAPTAAPLNVQPQQPAQPAPAAPAPTAMAGAGPTATPVSRLTEPPPARPVPTPSTAPTKGGTLRVVSVGSVQSFDPLWTTASATGNVTSTILEGLLANTADYGLGPVLLDSWTTSPDGLTWTFKIRDGVKFHDGTPLTTKEVIGTLNRQKEGAPVLRLVWKEFGPPDFAEFVRADDNLNFSIHLKEPTGLVLTALGPQNFWPQIVTEPWYTVPQGQSAPGTPIGTGPYKFEAWTPGDRWSAVRYDDYKPSPAPTDGQAGKHVAYIDRVMYIEVPDQTARVAALQVGEVDMAQEFPPDLLPRLERDPRVDLYDQPAFRLLGHFNHLKPPFDQRVARKALVMAYDNEKALLAAVGDPKFMRLCPSLLQCGTRWETAAGSEGLYNVKNIEEARKMIQEAGLAGTRVRLMDPQDRQPAHGAAQVTREVLEAIGFQVEFQAMDWATMVTRRADPELWEFFHTWSGITVRASPVGHLMFGELQYNAWFNKYQDLDGKQRELFSRLARATTDEEMKALNEEFQRYFYEDAIFLQIGEFFNRWAARSVVKGLHSGAGGQNPYDKWIED